MFDLYLFVRSSLCRRQHLPIICTLFCHVHIIKRSFLTSCVLRFIRLWVAYECVDPSACAKPTCCRWGQLGHPVTHVHARLESSQTQCASASSSCLPVETPGDRRITPQLGGGGGGTTEIKRKYFCLSGGHMAWVIKGSVWGVVIPHP